MSGFERVSAVRTSMGDYVVMLVMDEDTTATFVEALVLGADVLGDTAPSRLLRELSNGIATQTGLAEPT